MTLDRRTLEWMHAKVDAEIGDSENSELEGFLESDAVARERFSELRELAERLERIESVEPPSGLRAEVLGALPRASPRFRLSWSWRRYGYALAAGVILGVVAYHWGVTGGLDPQHLSGSMTAMPVDVLDETDLRFVGGSGSARIERSADGLALVAEIDSSRIVEASIEMSDLDAGFLGFRADPGESVSLQASDGRVSWTQSGRQRVVVLLDPASSVPVTLELELSADGEPLTAVSLTLPGGGP